MVQHLIILTIIFDLIILNLKIFAKKLVNLNQKYMRDHYYCGQKKCYAMTKNDWLSTYGNCKTEGSIIELDR